MVYNKEQYKDATNINARIALHEKYSTNPQGFHEWVFDQMDLNGGYCILECGCGPGALWFKNKDKIKKPMEVTLVDLSAGMLENAKNNIGSINCVNFNYIEADIQELPFKDESFDVVIANHMLYHIPDINKAIKEVFRVLKPKGSFYSSTFSRKHMHQLNILTNKYVELPKERVSDRFTLENGYDYIKEVFGNVEVKIHKDSLLVNDADAIINYIMSGSYAKKQLVGAKKEKFVSDVKYMFDQKPEMFIQKEAGVLIAHK